jgi:hypothetical protein
VLGVWVHGQDNLKHLPIENIDAVYTEQMINGLRCAGMREWRTTIMRFDTEGTVGLWAVFKSETALQLSLSGSRG